MQVSRTPQPSTPRPNPAPAATGPERSVAPSRTFHPFLEEKLGVHVAMDFKGMVGGPGVPLGVMDGRNRLNEYRSPNDPPVTKGIVFEGSTAQVSNAPVAGAPDVAWNPYDYMPRFVFHPDEDAYPVDPAFDGDSNLENNAPAKANGKDGNYRDGVIGGRQGLSGGFAVTQKGEYTVLTYSFYFPTNKAGHYHTKDWSQAQVYLKPDKDGKLQPAYLYTSWHHGGVLTEWDQLRKDKQGRPVINVGLGSHSLQPLGKGQALPKDGLQLRGDGQAELGGKVLPQKLSLDAFQGNVEGVRVLQPDDTAYKPRLTSMRYGSVGFDPLMPESFKAHGGLGKATEDKADSVLDSALDKASQLGNKAKGFLNGLFN